MAEEVDVDGTISGCDERDSEGTRERTVLLTERFPYALRRNISERETVDGAAFEVLSREKLFEPDSI